MNPDLLKRLDFSEMLAKESGDVDRLELIAIIRTQAKALEISDNALESIFNECEEYRMGKQDGFPRIIIQGAAKEARAEIKRIMGEFK